jgi:hypothetical protein
MYAATPEVQIGAYPDLWRKGRYRVDLVAELYFDPDYLDAALKQLDYHVVDADQRGQSYRHNQDDNRTAELDESEEEGAYVRLVLRDGDLDEADIDAARDYLSSLYERMYQISQEWCDAYDYRPPCCSMCSEAESKVLFTSAADKYDLTYALA